MEQEDSGENRLKIIQDGLADAKLIGPLVQMCKTSDQAEALIKLVETVCDKQCLGTIMLLGPKNSGKSVTLGLTIASAIKSKYSNIFVTSSSSSDLNTIFEWAIIGLKSLGYVEDENFHLSRSSSRTYSSGNITRIDVIKKFRQIVQYIDPYEAVADDMLEKSAQLLILDEAAALPMNIAKKLLGSYLTLISCTTSGLMASGRQRVSQLVKSLKRDMNKLKTLDPENSLQELSFNQVLDESFESTMKDHNTKFLKYLSWNDSDFGEITGCPPPDDCGLFLIDRDVLLRKKNSAENFIRRLVALYHASSYQANLDIIQNIFESKNHLLFCLVPPVVNLSESSSKTPEILCLILVSIQADGDVTDRITKEYYDTSMKVLNGAHILRISTHPSYDEKEYGYGKKAIQLLEEYFRGHLNFDLGVSSTDQNKVKCPFLIQLSQRKSELYDYLTVSTDLNHESIKFWRKSGYIMVDINADSDPISKEHGCTLLKSLIREDEEESRSNVWVLKLWQLFRNRFLSMLGSNLRHLPGILGVEILQEDEFLARQTPARVLNREELEIYLTLHDLKRLRIYSQFRDDHRRITDLIPILSSFYFRGKFGEKVHLSPAQMIIMLGIGLQGKSVDEVSSELGLPGNQVLAHFLKAVKKLSTWLDGIEEEAIGKSLGLDRQRYDNMYSMQPVQGTLDDELEDAARDIVRAEQKSLKSMTHEMKRLAKYAIKGTEDEWDQVLKSGHKPIITIKT